MFRKLVSLAIAMAIAGSVPASADFRPADFRPRDKYCVGNPPRQTEDPLSPGCVPFYDGENGGVTARGVTADEIRVVLYNDLGIEGDMSTPWRPSDESRGSEVSYDDRNLVRTIKAHLRYHQQRYQTYGRRVRVFAQASSRAFECGLDESDADVTRAEYDPFAVVVLGNSHPCYVQRLAQYGIPTFGLNQPAIREQYDTAAGHAYGFFPDVELEAAMSASLLCRELSGRPARFTSDPLLNGDVRTFGLIKPVNSVRGPAFEAAADEMIDAFAAQCGGTFDVQPYRASGTLGGWAEAPAIMSHFKREGVTTVLCYCMPVPTEVTVTAMQNAATSLGYFPEWYWDSASAMDRSTWQTLFGSKQQQAFGMSSFWRQPPFHQQFHYQAYLQQDPGTKPNARWSFPAYTSFQMLFTAIQLAGATLTADAIAEELSAFASRYPSNPFHPSGGYDDVALSPQTFIDTALAWWWDSTGTPPGGRQGEGCFRVKDRGLRSTVGTWPEGDDGFFSAGAPCAILQPWFLMEDPVQL